MHAFAAVIRTTHTPIFVQGIIAYLKQQKIGLTIRRILLLSLLFAAAYFLSACGGGGGSSSSTTKSTPTVVFGLSTTNPITLQAGSSGLTIGASLNYSGSTTPTGAITFSSSNTAIAQVDSSTGKLTAISAGTATITATYPGDSNWNTASASYSLTVTSASPVPSSEVKYPVPLVYQDADYTCATTSLAMAISYFDKLETPITNAVAWSISGSSIDAIHSTGNDMDGLKRFADHYRYKSEYINNMSTDMLEKLLNANALIVLNIKAADTGTATHAVLATGYNNSTRKIYVNDPAKRVTEFDYTYLESRWSAYLTTPLGMSTRSGFVIYPTKF